MPKSRNVSFLFRVLGSLLTAGALCSTLLGNEVQGQTRPGLTLMKKTEQAEAALVLEALTKDWALVDSNPDVDFLVFVSEDREALDFYPKKAFIQMVERSGLIENLDKEGSSVRDPYTYYERDLSVWKEITEAGTIVFLYRATPKGRLFLRDAPKRIGKPLPPLRVAAAPIDIPRKPLKVVTYNREAIQKLVDAFVQKSKMQIDGVVNDVNPNVSATAYLVCGPKLWRQVELQARLNGLRPRGALHSRTFNLMDGTETTKRLEDQPLLTSDEVRLFWKTLRETFKLEERTLIRRAAAGEVSEVSEYLDQKKISDDDFPSPDLSSLSIMFIVEANKSKFVVLVESKPGADLKHFAPQITWVELIESTDKE